jgi:hypothetical protein
MIIILRFRDLKERGIVNSWPQLKRLQTEQGFPLGRMLSPNIRAWSEDEIEAWFAERPVENLMPLKGAPKARHAARAAAQSEQSGPDQAA